MSTMAAEKLVKQPGESRLYSFEFSALLADGETLTGTPTVTAAPSDLTIGDPSISGTTVQVRISSGTSGITYKVECTVATSASNTLEGDGELVVSD